MHFTMNSTTTTILLSLLAASIAQNNDFEDSICNNDLSNRPNKKRDCDKACKCDCDEYWEVDEVCLDWCGQTNNDPMTVLPWCSDFSRVADCDIYGGGWSDATSTIESYLDETYMTAYGREFKLDFFTDSAVNEDLPLAIVIHGGGFNSGSKNNCKPMHSALEFASRGYRTIAINYPKCGAYWNGTFTEEVPDFGTSERGIPIGWDSPAPLYPLYTQQQHEQCKGGGASSGIHPEQYAWAAEIVNRAARYAIAYAHERADIWKINTDQTICFGSSAGAISCFELFMYNSMAQYKPEKSGLAKLPDELDAIKIDVASGRSGGAIPAYRNVSQHTVDTMMAENAAIYNLHGDQDDIVNITSAYFLRDVMETYGIPMKLTVAEGEGHGMFEYQFLENPDLLDEMYDFIQNNLNGEDNDSDDDDDDDDDDLNDDDDGDDLVDDDDDDDDIDDGLAETLAEMNAQFNNVNVELLEWPSELHEQLGNITELALVTRPLSLENSNNKLPLLINLHGGGARWWIKSLQERLETAAEQGIKRGYDLAELSGKEILVLDPQTSYQWNAASLDIMLDYVLENLFSDEVDEDRVYVMGYSAGGGATWRWINESPERFAAASPNGFSGGSRNDDATKLANLPIWAMAGSEDGRNPSGILNMVQRLETVGNSNVEYTIFEGLDHKGGGVAVYNTVELVDWMLQFNTASEDDDDDDDEILDDDDLDNSDDDLDDDDVDDDDADDDNEPDDDDNVCEDDDNGLIEFVKAQTGRTVRGCNQVVNSPANPCSTKPQFLQFCCESCAVKQSLDINISSLRGSSSINSNKDDANNGWW